MTGVVNIYIYILCVFINLLIDLLIILRTAIQRAGISQWYSAGFTTASRPALGPTQHPIQWVPGAPSRG
jgi:hypothetical protein